MDPVARAYLTNLRPGGLAGRLGRALVILVLWCGVLAPPWLALDWYAGWCAQVPRAPDILQRDDPGVATAILGSDGVRLGGSARQTFRPWVSIDDVPPLVIAAFVAAEDEAFFVHDGVDPRGLARAAWVNLRRQQTAQGGSTITQQLAKMYVGRERTYERKLREAVLARRIEQRYTKLEILEAWLNRIYLGAGAHGVAAAAERYFGRPLDALELHEVALIAGLTAAPSRLEPFGNPQGALERRAYVLRRMAELGLVTQDEREAADARPLELDTSRPDDASAPYLASAARRELRGLDLRWPLEARGRVVETTASLALQRRAVDEVARGAEQLARNRRDPVRLARLAPEEHAAFLADARSRYGESRASGRRYAGVVVEVDEAALRVRVDTGGVVAEIAGARLDWLRGIEPEARRGEKKRKKKKAEPHPLSERLAVGDVVQVRLLEDATAGGNEERLHEAGRSGDESRLRDEEPVIDAELLPVAGIQGALVSLEVDSGAVRALAGGTGFDVSQYDRATRGCRQPGSAFKPVLFALALARGMTPASLVHDLPVRYEDGSGRLIWEPRNADRDFEGTLTLSAALAHSRNLPTVKLAHRLGLQALVQTARALGITSSELRATPSLALGASCVTPLEMTAAYGAFARRGRRLDPYLVRAAYTSEGRLLLDRGAPSEPAGPLDARLHRLARWLREPPEAVLPAAAAYQTVYLLRQVVVGGTGYGARALEVASAGKTGTTNRFDVWYVGFTEDVLTGVWLGDDRNRQDLGEGESGGTSALPVWLAYTREAIAGRAQGDPLDGPPPGVDFRRIDPASGKLAHPEGPGRWMPFVPGSAPQEVAPGPTERDAAAADFLDREL